MGHWQFAICSCTAHSAIKPQAPEHGLVHFILLQANCDGQSLLLVHSGRQYGGEPKYCWRQLQEAWPLIDAQCAFSPQGDGRHGSIGSATGSVITIGAHLTSGSPVYPELQPQMALWLMGRHIALLPQAPKHGSIHFWLMHVLVGRQSELRTHSGRQVGAEP